MIANKLFTVLILATYVVNVASHTNMGGYSSLCGYNIPNQGYHNFNAAGTLPASMITGAPPTSSYLCGQSFPMTFTYSKTYAGILIGANYPTQIVGGGGDIVSTDTNIVSMACTKGAQVANGQKLSTSTTKFTWNTPSMGGNNGCGNTIALQIAVDVSSTVYIYNVGLYTPVACTGTGITGTAGSCVCASGYAGTVTYNNGVLGGCTQCAAGTFAAGTPTCTQCSAPAANTYVSAICSTTANTQTSPCAVAPTGYAVLTQCSAGSSTLLGSNTVLQCAAGFSGTAAVSGTSASGCTACLAGTIKTALGNTQCIACAGASANSFVSTLCTSLVNTVSTACSNPAANFYATSVCSAGSATSLGSNTKTSACTAPTLGTNFVSTVCIPGSSTQTGSNSQLTACVAASAGYVVNIACAPGTPTSQGAQATFSCAPGYTGTAALNGATLSGCNLQASTTCLLGSTYSSTGVTGGQCTGCVGPQAGFYTTSLCTILANTVTSACSTPTSGYSILNNCIAGSNTVKGTDTVFQCAAGFGGSALSNASGCTSCGSGTYKANAGNSLSCTTCTTATAGQYVSSVCTTTTNSQVSSCAVAATGYTLVTACAIGSPISQGSQAVYKCATGYSGTVAISATGVLSGCSSCSLGLYTPSGTTQCVSCAIVPANSYSTTVCSGNTNTASSPCATTTPGSGYVLASNCISGSATLLGSQSTFTCDTGFTGTAIVDNAGNLSGCNLITTTTVAVTTTSTLPNQNNNTTNINGQQGAAAGAFGSNLDPAYTIPIYVFIGFFGFIILGVGFQAGAGKMCYKNVSRGARAAINSFKWNNNPALATQNSNRKMEKFEVTKV